MTKKEKLRNHRRNSAWLKNYNTELTNSLKQTTFGESLIKAAESYAYENDISLRDALAKPYIQWFVKHYGLEAEVNQAFKNR